MIFGRAAHAIGAFLLAVTLGTGWASTAAAEPDDATIDWAMKVLLGAEFGDATPIAYRWARQPTLSIFTSDATFAAAIETAVQEINSVLKTTPVGPITFTDRYNADADIQVYVAPLASFPKLAQSLGFTYYPENWGYFWRFSNQRAEIERAYVLLASDRLFGMSLRHFALEEITQSLGPTNDSPVYPESIFYANGDDGGAAQRLSSRDRELIEFLYTHVAPGTGREQMKALLMEYW